MPDNWQDISSAPLDRAIQARIPGNGDDNIIMWHDEPLISAWVFATEQEPPPCWTDGYCWEVNEDGVRSAWPTHWKEAPTDKEPVG